MAPSWLVILSRSTYTWLTVDKGAQNPVLEFAYSSSHTISAVYWFTNIQNNN